MNIGTKSILFGVHQFAIHPWFVAAAWWRLYGFPWDPRLWVAFFVHDLGYWGKPNMDGPEGETHPILGARIMHALFDWSVYVSAQCARKLWRGDIEMDEYGGRTLLTLRTGNWSRWHDFTLLHSRFYAKKKGRPFSRLCVADKLAISLTPRWLYLWQARLTGELEEYMAGAGARTPAGDRSPEQWLSDVQRYCRAWAFEHRDGKDDTWTGTVRDLAESKIENTKPSGGGTDHE